MSFTRKCTERKKIKDLAIRIKPVVNFENIGFCYIAPVDLFNGKFLDNPQQVEIAPEMELVKEIKTYHTMVVEDEFIPTVSEILSQIPEELLDFVIAFEVVATSVETEDGRHSVLTKLYKKA